MNNVKAFNVTVQGANHIKKNKVCQDSSCSYYESNDISYAIVCDGHGGDDYIRSDIGSKEATQVAAACICDFVDTVLKKYDLPYMQRHYEEVLRDLAASIISQWRERIEEHFSNNPLTDEENAIISDKAKKKYVEGNVASAYGTTLIAVVYTDEYWFGIKIGDGKCVAINKTGEFAMPIPDDGICFLNATTSICDKNAIENFRYAFSADIPAAVFVGTDGIDDCFNRDEQLFKLYKTTLYSFVTSDFEKAVSDLGDYLPRLSAKGSGDDVSIGGIIDFDVAKKLDMVLNFDTTPKVVTEVKNDIEVSERFDTRSPNEVPETLDAANVSNNDFDKIDEKNTDFVGKEAEPDKVDVAVAVTVKFENTPTESYVRVGNSNIYKAVKTIIPVNNIYNMEPESKNIGSDAVTQDNGGSKA